MTKGQRALIGLSVISLISIAIWAMIASAFAQLPPHDLRGNVRVMVQFENRRNVDSLCGIMTSGRLRNVAACANPNIIVAPNPCHERGEYAQILCHELGHVNGWRAEHPAT